jgi:hypothetical protein
LIPLLKDEKSDTRKKQNPHDDFGSLVAVPLEFEKKKQKPHWSQASNWVFN